MKKLLSVLFLFLLSQAVYGTEYSEYASRKYSEDCKVQNPKISVKKEHVEEYGQEIGKTFIPYIVYGYGDLKAKKCRKQRVSYICLLNKDFKPIWSYIIPR